MVPDAGPGQSASPRPIERICDDVRGAETVLAQRFDVERFYLGKSDHFVSIRSPSLNDVHVPP